MSGYQFGSVSSAPPGASPSQFGGYGGGGGFMQDAQMSPQSQGILSPPRQGGSLSQRQSLTPLTIRQILKAQEPDAQQPFEIDGHELSQIQLVGQIMDVDPQSTFIMYTLDDGTGQIQCKKWTNDQEDENDVEVMEKRSALVKGIYVKIIGRVAMFNQQKSVTTFVLIPITDFNELTYHNLECILAHGTHIQEMKNQGGSVHDAGQQFVGAPGHGGGFGGGMGGGGGGDVFMEGDSSFSDVQKQVLRVFESSRDEEGCHINAVFGALNQIDKQEIRAAVDFLSSEGHLYSTVDEEHFKCTHD